MIPKRPEIQVFCFTISFLACFDTFCDDGVVLCGDFGCVTINGEYHAFIIASDAVIGDEAFFELCVLFYVVGNLRFG